METQTCSTCKEEKEIKHFEFRKDTNKYRGQCRKCSKGYESNIQEKQEAIKKLFEQGLKSCSRCQEIKSLDDFSIDKQTTTGKCSLCKECIKNKYTSEEIRNQKYKWMYGISLEDYNTMCISQNNKCLLCGDISFKLVVDHCHITGKVRGLLCGRCNSGLGMFRDNTTAMANAISYINNHKT